MKKKIHRPNAFKNIWDKTKSNALLAETSETEIDTILENDISLNHLTEGTISYKICSKILNRPVTVVYCLLRL